jgi:hypothetical protein
MIGCGYDYIDGSQSRRPRLPLESVKKNEADREPGYFLNNAPRMRHRWFRSRGLFTSSGVVGAGGKAVPAAASGGQRRPAAQAIRRCTGPSTEPTPF